MKVVHWYKYETDEEEPVFTEDRYKVTCLNCKSKLSADTAQHGVQADEFVCAACQKSLAAFWSFCPQCGEAQVIRR